MKAFYMLSRCASSFPYLLVSISVYILFSWLIYLVLLDSYVVMSLLLDLSETNYIYYMLIACELTLLFMEALNMLLRYVLSFLCLLILWLCMACLSILDYDFIIALIYLFYSWYPLIYILIVIVTSI